MNAPRIPRRRAEEEIYSAQLSVDHEQASKEAYQLGSGRSEDELRKEAQENEHRRAEEFKKHFERIWLLGLYVASAALGLILIILLWHMLVPQALRWLGPEQISELKSIITGGALTGLVASHLKKRL